MGGVVSKSFAGIIEVIDRLWACDDFAQVGAITGEYSETLGFQTAIITCTGKMLATDGKMPPFWSTANPEWLKTYVENDYYAVDPRVQMAARSSKPFSFAEAYVDPTPEVQRFLEASNSYGMLYGWVFPVHKTNKATGLVGFSSSKEIKLDAFTQLQLSMVCMVAYEKGMQYFVDNIPEAGLRLTDRERSVLSLVARGKTNWEIGTVLSISEYSVRDYLKTLSVKLKTSNRTHSVARAMQLGLIVP